MNEVEKQSDSPPIKVHQCLFGYQDGHRLLGTSLQLPEEAASVLLLLSDLAPGLSLPAHGGYWTGVPLPSVKSYALMHTWLASEMSRPGCVWTHVLIIAFSDIARFPDLSILIEHFTRPSAATNFENYGTPILLAPLSAGATLRQQTSSFAKVDALRVIQAIYADHGTGTVIAPLGALDDAIFAIWSQQWPRLRRSFSFRTATSSNENLSFNTKKFDLVVLLVSNRNQDRAIDNDLNSIEAWEKICIDDLLFPHNTEFRRFLWRYGSDVRLGRKRFKFLVNIYLSTRFTRLGDKSLHTLLANVIEVLPSVEDGKVLKEDLVVGSNQYSLLPSLDPIDLLAFYVNNPAASKLPTLLTTTFEAIQQNWLDRSEEILSIGEKAAERATELNGKLLDQLAAVSDASTFLFSTQTRPNLRNKLLASKPSLLDSDYLLNISSVELLRLIKHVPDDAHILIERILLRLLEVDDINLAEEMTRRFPDSAIAVVMEAIESFFTGDRTTIPQTWVKSISVQSSKILKSGFIGRARTTSALAFFASMLGYVQPATLQAGPMPWVNGLKNSRDNLNGFERQKFLAFLLELALYEPTDGCELLFEIAFDSIHTDLKYSKLCLEQLSQLLYFLPNLSWFKNWDYCLRLRLGIVDAYVKHNLNPTSFKRLTTNPYLYEELVELAGNSKAGRKFLKKLN